MNSSILQGITYGYNINSSSIFVFDLVLETQEHQSIFVSS